MGRNTGRFVDKTAVFWEDTIECQNFPLSVDVTGRSLEVGYARVSILRISGDVHRPKQDEEVLVSPHFSWKVDGRIKQDVFQRRALIASFCGSMRLLSKTVLVLSVMS